MRPLISAADRAWKTREEAFSDFPGQQALNNDMAASGSSSLPEKMTPAPHPNLYDHYMPADSSFELFQQHSASDEFASSSAAKKPTRQGERERSDSDYAKPFSLDSRASERSFSRGSRHARHSSVRTLPCSLPPVQLLGTFANSPKSMDRFSRSVIRRRLESDRPTTRAASTDNLCAAPLCYG